jgi:hypothetical protein
MNFFLHSGDQASTCTSLVFSVPTSRLTYLLPYSTASVIFIIVLMSIQKVNIEANVSYSLPSSPVFFVSQ